MVIGMTIGLLTGITVWWLLVRRLQDKPWTEKGLLPASQDDLTANAAKVGLWIFLGVVTSLFLILNSAYLMRMEHAGGFAPWVAVDEPAVLWLNTAMLVLASVTLQRATNAAAHREFGAARTSYLAGGLLTLGFLAGQLLAWHQLAASGAYDAGTPAYAFFLLVTALHGLHLIGGLGVLAVTTGRIWNVPEHAPEATVGTLRQSVQLTTTYWHFLLVVWLALFALLSFT